jgi:Domain of unknown function (DUF4177)
MQQWEYRTVKVEAKGWFTGGVLDQSKFETALNELGRDGWELVSTFDTNMLHGQTREIVAVLKRSKR